MSQEIEGILSLMFTHGGQPICELLTFKSNEKAKGNPYESKIQLAPIDFK